ncbi:MAG: hypothetical protein WA639_23610 [Candidatus Acidiferrum sp.]
MSFSPDIIVTGEDTPRILLAAEVKLLRPNGKDDETRLKTYMLQMRCPIGLLVTPDVIEVFRDTYTAHSENSVERVASFPSPKAWQNFKAAHQGEPHAGLRFEETVRFWLEQLDASASPNLSEFPPQTREALSAYVLPALIQGVVRSTGPRESLTSR